MLLLHFESTGEELLDMLNVCKVLSPNDQIILIYNDKYLSSRVAPDEQRIVGLGHVEVDLVKILVYLRVSGSRCLLEAVIVTIFGYDVKLSETNKPRMCNIAHALSK